ncbi:hypothetical protein DFH09DRAFT_1320777 [Mycena vulgaris]|nr:hypothetical protein DFH09DRAFT_1320777 [Mycena vulgaris]
MTHTLVVSESLRRSLAKSARARHDAALILRQLAAADRDAESRMRAGDKSMAELRLSDGERGGQGAEVRAEIALPLMRFLPAPPHQRPTNARAAPYALRMLTMSSISLLLTSQSQLFSWNKHCPSVGISPIFFRVYIMSYEACLILPSSSSERVLLDVTLGPFVEVIPRGFSI